MPVATCPSREELIEYAVGKLPDDASDSLANHLDGCPNCQAELAALPELDDSLVARLRDPLPVDPILEEPGFGRAMARARTAVTNDGSTTDLPQQLGEYQLIQRLGGGGMGTVYKARQGRLDRIVALKVLSRGRTDDPRAILRFEREMKAIGRFDHPHIVRAYDAREINDTPVLVMEFVDGLDLAEIVRRNGPVAAPEACEMIRQTALALQCAHEHGLVHRDVKPSNIMLARSGEVKLLDLGLARFYAEGAANVVPAADGEDTTYAGQVMGTADYMAPEQASDSRTVDIRADLYSLGCTLYKLLTGLAPFGGPEYRTSLDKMNAHVHQPAPSVRQFAPEAPEGLASVVERMLAKNPDQRFSTPTEVCAALGPYCAGADLPALLARAKASPPLPPVEERSEGRESRESQERPRRQGRSGPRPSLLPTSRGRKPFIGRWILLVMVGVLAFVLGIMVRIHKDGKVTSIELPGGVTAHLNANGTLDIDVSGGEKPAADATTLRSFTTADATISNELSKADGTWSVKCEDRSLTQPIHLFEVPEPGIDNCMVIYRAKLKSEGLKGRAYLVMWCRFPGRGEFFSKGLDHVLSGSTDWSTYQVPFFLKNGEKPDLIKLDLAVAGSGKIEVKDVELLKTELPAGPEIAAEESPAVKSEPSHERVAAASPAVPPVVHVSQPITREVSDYLDFTGNTEAAQFAQIRSRVTGELIKVLVKPGRSVKKGDLLMEIDPRMCRAELDQASNALKQAKIRLESRTQEFARTQALLRSAVISQGESNQAKNQLADAEAAIQTAEAALEVARLRLEYTRIVAPFAGKISGPLVDEGNLVTADKTILATISSTDPMIVAFDMDGRSSRAIRRNAGDKADPMLLLPVACGLANDEGLPYKATMDSVNGQFDSATGTVHCRAVLANKEGTLMPGMFVRVRLTTRGPYKALVIPERAIGSDQGQKYVLVVNDRNIAERRAIDTGALQGDGMRSVTHGLKAEDWVITSDIQKLTPGMSVKPEKPAAPTSDPVQAEKRP